MSDPSSGNANKAAADNALQIAGSIVSILTFVYALAVGLYLYAKTAASSPQEINEFIISLQFSYEEMQRFAHSLANYQKERIDASGPPSSLPLSAGPPPSSIGQPVPPVAAAPPPDPEAQALAAKAYLIEGHTASRLESLRKLALKVGTMANDGFFRQWSNRVRYVLLQEELAKQVAGKDRLMEELRRVQESFDKAAEERRLKRHEALLEQQSGLLRRLTNRLDRLEGTSEHRLSSGELSHSSLQDSGFYSRDDSVVKPQAAVH